MIKSRYSDPAIDGHGFINHIHSIDRDMGVIPGTDTPLIEAYKIEMIQKLQSTSGTGGKPRNLALFRKIIADDPSAGVWHLIHMWTEGDVTKGADYDESSAAGSVDVLPDGTVHVVMSFGKRTAPGATTYQYQPWEATVRRTTFAPAIERLPTGGTGNDPRYDALVSQLGALGQQVAQLQAGGGMQLLPAPRTSPAWEGRTLTGGVEVDVPLTFGVPSAPAYLIRFVASAAKADVRVRAGTSAAPYFLTLNLVVPNLQSHIQGWAPGPLMYVSTAQGEAKVWLQVLGSSG